MDDNDLLMKFYEEHSTWERHHETQRGSLTTVSIAIAAAITGIITFDKQLAATDLPLAWFLLIQGMAGALFTQKQYERFWQHKERANQYREALDKAFPNAKLLLLREAAEKMNKKKFPVIRKVRLHYFWNCIHLAIAFLGAALIVIIAK